MTIRATARVVPTIALAAALAAPAAGAAARGCPADGLLVRSMIATLTASLPLAEEQTKLLSQIVALRSANQSVPADVVDRLRTLTARSRRVISSGERSLAALAPGTPQGRTFRRIATRYLHDSARPLNECFVQAVAARTLRELGASVTCFEAGQRKDGQLRRQINASMQELVKVRRCTIGS